MNQVSLKGVLIGGIVDVLATNVLSLPVIFYVIAKLHAEHVPKDQMQTAVLSSIHGNPFLFSIQALIGLGCSILGGHLAARIAKRSARLNGALSAWLCVCIGIYSLVTGFGTSAIGLKLADLVISPLAGFFGGHLYLKSKKPESA